MNTITKKIKLLLLLSCLTLVMYGQEKGMGLDCNPKLNDQEINYLNNLFPTHNYDFKNKTIGFANPNVVRFWGVINFAGFNGSLLPIDKKEYFRIVTQKTKRKNVSLLLPLNEEQKKQSGGFDAIVLFLPQKQQKRVSVKTTASLAKFFGYRQLNYPDNLHLVGNDSNLEFTAEDAAFFNTIYKHRKGSFDFKDKKIAFVNPNEQKPLQVRTKIEYIVKVKDHLENDFLYPTGGDRLMILSENEKKETGYDAVIVFSNSKTNDHRGVLEALKEQKK